MLGWFLNCLGAFPSSAASRTRSRSKPPALLERGQAVVIFPEGTRIRTGSLARPKRGVGRLALQSGAPVVPIAVTGASTPAAAGGSSRSGSTCAAGPPLTFPRVEDPSPVPGRRGHRADLAVRRAPVGVARRAAAAAHGGRGGRRLDGHRRRHRPRARRTRSAARLPHRRAGGELLGRARERAYLPGRGARPRDRRARPCREIEFAGVDLVVLAVPCASCPPPSARSARAWATAPRCWCLEGPRAAARHDPGRLRGRARARPRRGRARRTRSRARGDRARRVGGGATRDADLRRQLREVLEAGGLTVEATDDVTGAELAGLREERRRARLRRGRGRAARTSPAPPRPVFSEVHELAVASGGRSETFAGLAGAGDLVATALAEGSRNRRAGELVGAGRARRRRSRRRSTRPPSRSPRCRCSPTRSSARASRRRSPRARRVLDGEDSADQWLESVRSARPATAPHSRGLRREG